MQREIFRTVSFYIKTLEDILECLVQQENYDKAAEIRDLIIYEKISDPDVRKSYKFELVDKYNKRCLVTKATQNT